MQNVMGVDAGGSKVDVVLMDERGSILGWGRGGPAQRWYSEEAACESAVETAFCDALSGQKSISIGRIAGTAPESVWRILRGLIQDFGCRSIRDSFSEAELALASAMQSYGCVVHSGTGSFVFARLRDGRFRQWGGEGPLLGDEGSAYKMGIAAIRETLRVSVARESSDLPGAVHDFLGAVSRKAILEIFYEQGISRNRVAALALVVNRLAEKGDPLARRVLFSAADELSSLITELLGSLDPGNASLPLIASGGVVLHSRLYWQRILEKLSPLDSLLRPMRPEIQPVLGACLLALKEIGVDWDAGIMSRIVENQAEFRPRQGAMR